MTRTVAPASDQPADDERDAGDAESSRFGNRGYVANRTELLLPQQKVRAIGNLVAVRVAAGT